MADTRKEIHEIVGKLQKQGWRTRLGKHVVLYPPNPNVKPVMISFTPGHSRWREITLTKLRRAGAKL